MIRNRLAQLMVRHETAYRQGASVGPFFFMPATPSNPFSRGRFLRCGRHSFDQFIIPRNADQIDDHFRPPDADQMTVALFQSRHDRLPVQIDDPGLRTDIRLDIGIRTNHGDLVADNRHSLRLRPALIHRIDHAVLQHQIRRRLTHLRPGVGRQQKSRQQTGDNK